MTPFAAAARMLALVTLLTLLAAATPTAPVAHAGTYDVYACDPNHGPSAAR